MSQAQLNEFRQKLTDLYAALKNSTPSLSAPETSSVHGQLTGHFNAYNTMLDYGRLASVGDMEAIRCELTELNAEIHKAAEIQQAELLTTQDYSTSSIKSYWKTPGLLEVLEAETIAWKDAGLLEKTRRLVVVGGGAVPQSQLFYFDKLNLPVACVEIDQHAASLCESLLKSLGKEFLPVFNCDGGEFSYEENDLVVVALLVPEKFEVARQVASCTSASTLTLRLPVGLHEFWFEGTALADIASLGWRKVTEHCPPNSTIASITFVKRG